MGKGKSIYLKILLLVTLLATSGCSSYSNRWDCGRVRGIGCSSVEEVDNVARDHIILNSEGEEKN